MHISSLPGPYGIGCFSKEAYAFVDRLASAGQAYWQILPIGTISYGDSPYQSFSIHAGNPYFIDLSALIERGLLTAAECDAALPAQDEARVDYALQYERRYALLHKAFDRSGWRSDVAFAAFCKAQAAWLDDYALYTVIKAANGAVGWADWPAPLRDRAPEALAQARRENAEELAFYQYLQFLFFTQWRALKAYANARGVRIIGDIPIYVAYDSADVWADRAQFRLDESGRMTDVAGVPPDGFSADGQVWGNPLYDWAYMRENGYRWWIDRIGHAIGMFDVVRIDHFRGFDEFFAIRNGEATARNGRWETGPGKALFRALHAVYGELPIIAEDLGYMTDSVRALVEACGYPNMKVFEFAFDARDSSNMASEYLPENYPENCAAYTGTHDNETVMGWCRSITEGERASLCRYLGVPAVGADTPVRIIERIAHSRAVLCVIPIQDYLCLDNAARMNRPSTVGGNWMFRVTREQLSSALFSVMRRIATESGRAAEDA